MKKHYLLLLAASLLQLSARAQMLKPTWEITTEAHQDVSGMKINAPVSITDDGSIYQTGTFDQEITIGETTLEPVATSAFLAKYTTSGTPVWAIALEGAATITAIDVEDSYVAIAGVFAEEVTFGSTDGNTQTVNGYAECTEQISGFIATYDADGKLLAVKAVVPEMNADLLETFMYFPEPSLGDIYFRPDNLKLNNGRIYLSAAYAADNTIGDVTLNGKVINVWDFMYMDIASMAIISLDAATLDNCKLEANIATSENMAYDQMQPETMNFDVDEKGNVRFAFIGYGNLAVETSDNIYPFSFSYDYEGNNEHGMVVGTLPPPADPIIWESQIAATDDTTNLKKIVPTALDSKYNSYVTGTFDQELTFAGTTITPNVAVNSFLAKYGSNGTEEWIVALQGAATITTIDTDDSYVAIAGVFAEEVTFGSTDGNTQTVNGYAECTEQISGFIATYDADGKLLAVKAVVPEMNADLLETFMYFPEPSLGDIYFRPDNLKLNNGRIYLSAAYAADNTIGDVTLNGKVINVWDFMYMDIASMALISLDAATLDNCMLEANIATSENMSYNQMQPEAMNFTIDGQDIYLSFIGFGNLTLTTASGSQDFSFEYDDITGINEHGAVIANLSTGANKVYHATATDNLASFYSIYDMAVCDTLLMIAGTYNNTLPFNNELTPTGLSDIFAAAIDIENLSVVKTYSSNYDEGDDCREKLSGLLCPYYPDEDLLAYSGYIENINTHQINSGLYIICEGGICAVMDNEKALSTSLRDNTALMVTGKDGNYDVSNKYIVVKENEPSFNVYHATATDNLANFYDISSFECQEDGMALICGTYSNTLPLDNSCEAKGASDMFVATLEGNIVQDPVFTSNYDEGEKNAEVCTGITSDFKNIMAATGYVENTGDRTIVLPLNLVIEYEDKIESATVALETNTLVTSITAPDVDQDNYEYAATTVKNGSYILSYGNVLTEINETRQDINSASKVLINLQGIEVPQYYRGIVIRGGKAYLQ
ncbi:MAG: hypothetical protein MJY77_00325 [Bacteroidaceae bacterium]|nr:hypothetical protein [Bacteroidaceae bacterium]